jgi:hypothetical protein
VLTPDPNASPSTHRFTTTWNDQPFSVEVDRALAADPDGAKTIAENALDWLGDHLLDLTAACADELLAVYNDEWAEGDDAMEAEQLPIDRDHFRRRLAARSLMLVRDGTLRVAFDDDGMFSDHAVVIETDADRQPVEVFLEG